MSKKKGKHKQVSGKRDRSPAGDVTSDAITLRVGDYVRVRPGVCDPDFPDCEIGGWTGQISTVEDEDDDGDVICTVKWDRKTRNAMSPDLKARCKDQGIGVTEMDLDVADLERAEPPDQPVPDSLDELLQDMEDEGDWPSPDILAAIFSQGTAAIEPLREIVRRACVDPEETTCADVAAGILGDLRAHEAVPDLLRYLREGPPDAMDWITDALAALVDAMRLSELETVIRDQDLDPLRRAMAIDIYERVAEAQPEARATLISLLTVLLSDLAARADKLPSPEQEFAGNIALTLSQMGVDEARPLIDAALKAKVIAPWLASREDVEENYRDARQRKPAPPRTFLEEYRERYEEDEGTDEDEDGDERDPDEEPGWEDEDDEVVEAHAPVLYQPPAPIVRLKVGRNDPCPCGSGKKYKKCCLNRDSAPAVPIPAAPPPPPTCEKPFTVDTMKEALARELAARIGGAADRDASAAVSPEVGQVSIPPDHDDVPTIDYYEGHRLDDPGGREGLVEALVHDLEEGYFHTWHAVICQERGLKLTKDQKRRLDDLLDFNDEPSRILYINEIPRPRQAWYEIVREIASRLLVEPLDPNGDVYRTTTEGWADIADALDEHGRGLPLPEGVTRPVDVVPADLQHRLWIQWCIDELIGVSQEGGPTLADEKEHWRIEELVDRLRECKDSVAALNLTIDGLLAKIVMPERERELAGKLLTEALNLKSMSEPLGGRL